MKRKSKKIKPVKHFRWPFHFFLAWSIVAHMLILGPFLGGGTGNGNGGSGSEPDHTVGSFIPKVPIVDSPITVTHEEIKLDGQKKIKKTKKRKKTGKEEEYGGIGIMTFGPLITDAPPYYPAYKAGIRARDMIISPDVDTIKGEPGTVVIVTVKHENGVIETLVIVRDSIRIVTDPDPKK